MNRTDMVISRISGNLPLILLVALLLGGSAATVSAQSNYYGPSAMGPITARVLLLIPDDFERFVFASVIGGRETIHPFGREAANELRGMLTPAFGFMTVRSTDSRASAMDLLSPDNPGNAEVRGYDYIAVPRFGDLNSSSGPMRYKFEIDLVLDFYDTHGSKFTAVRGYGESTTGYWHPSTILDAGHLALRYAVEAIRDGIEGRRSTFAAVYRPEGAGSDCVGPAC